MLKKHVRLSALDEKKANFTFIFITRVITDLDNYRPVLLAPIYCKKYE